MYKIHIIGVGPEGPSSDMDAVLSPCGLIVTSERFHHLAGEKKIIPIAPVNNAIMSIKKALSDSDVGVIVGGDPLFFGIGRLIIEKFGRGAVTVHPALSSMQIAFSRMNEPWDNAIFLSLHGKRPGNIPGLILPYDKVFILTDKTNNPSSIAAKLLNALTGGLEDEYRVFVGARLGMESEEVFDGGLEDAARRVFPEPNVMIIIRNGKNGKDGSGPIFGLKESDISHSRGLITKDEVRAVAIHRLMPPKAGVLWDIGAGSGSISIETARLSSALEVYAIESDINEISNIRRNINAFRTWNVISIHGEAPEILSGLPAPDRVFIGGSGGRLAGIIAAVSSRLQKGGRVVVNAVTGKTKKDAPRLLAGAGFKIEISKISVTRRMTGQGTPLKLNTIDIITGIK
ncbi:MAG: precorrin-6y C5,15-methyltransferase (decarboxylating) subunit CbiE [Desulfobacteraceae bacterium]|nr:precorrin-6y C5,15-methyltransferase (decarboxylating) subunit CbiE [Desulfobacteraceae bacterium]